MHETSYTFILIFKYLLFTVRAERTFLNPFAVDRVYKN